MEVGGDLGGGFGRGETAGVDGKGWGGHGEGGEGSGGVELMEEGGVGEFLELAAGWAVDAGGEFFGGAGELDEVDLAAVVGDGFDGLRDEGGMDGGLGREGEDEAGEAGAAGVFEDGEPDLFAELDEGGGAEVEGGEEEIDGQVVVEEFVTGEVAELAGDGELPGGGRAVEEEEAHSGFKASTTVVRGAGKGRVFCICGCHGGATIHAAREAQVNRRSVLVQLVTLSVAIFWTARGSAQAISPSAAATSASHNAEASSDVGKYSNWDQIAGHQHGSLAFQGKVAVAGGTLPWDQIPVVVMCGDVARYNTQTDAKGGFQIQAAPRNSEVTPGKQDAKLLAPAQLIGCKVHAVLGGFESTTLTIANRSIMDDADVGTITLRRDEKSAGAVVSATTVAAPKEALKEFDKARGDANNRHAESAQKELEKAVKIYPQFAEAWYQLGKLEEAQKPQEALECYNKAIAADPSFYPPYEHVAAVAAVQKKWPEVVAATDHALQLDPDGTPQLWYYSAVGNFNMGQKETAEKSAKTSMAMDPSHVAPNTEQLLAVMLAGRGDYSGALEHLRNCLTYAAPGPNAELMKQQVAQLEKMTAK